MSKTVHLQNSERERECVACGYMSEYIKPPDSVLVANEKLKTELPAQIAEEINK